MSKTCPICLENRRVCFQSEILNKYTVDYLYCDRCGLLQTEEPYWLDEAYSDAIADADTGLVQRNLMISHKLSCLLFGLFGAHGCYLDIGGGYGLLTRLMRDKGFDFYWSDPHCVNLFAKGFAWSGVQSPFTAITAFEVLEHIYNPVEFIQQHLQANNTKTLIFSTDLFTGSPPDLRWPYYTFFTGQHITFYQPKTLKLVAEKIGLHFFSFNGIHIFSNQSIHPLVGTLITSKTLSPLLSNCLQIWMLSKTSTDSAYLTTPPSNTNS